jgi:hypothetical protein
MDLKKFRPLVICIEIVTPVEADGSKEWGSI